MNGVFIRFQRQQYDKDLEVFQSLIKCPKCLEGEKEMGNDEMFTNYFKKRYHKLEMINMKVKILLLELKEY